MTAQPTVAVILAAGLGKRMRSELPKVLHEVNGEAMIDHVLRAVGEAGVERVYVVVGHKGELVRARVGNRAVCVDQPERLGTGHAVLMAEPHLEGFAGNLLVTYGDMPLVSGATYRRMVERQAASQAAGVMLSAVFEDATGYGRIVRDERGEFLRVVEHRDATETERAINEVNTGVYCFDARLLFPALHKVGNANDQGEYYLTDVPEILIGSGQAFEVVVAEDPLETLGVNSRAQLAEVGKHLNQRLLAGLMEDGVTVTDPSTTRIESGCSVERDAVLEPFTILRGITRVSARAVVGPCTELIDASIGEEAVVRQSVVDSATVDPGEEVGPFDYVCE